ncbi:hypothetical protein [Streptomyces sp. NPDC001388]|uniref:hypothetical protein n=1 Tax=Streptomyces sp. NPDC001388 TaxID=3364568 RepID=UPI0036BA106E
MLVTADANPLNRDAKTLASQAASQADGLLRLLGAASAASGPRPHPPTDAQPTAESLALSRTTVRARLRAAENLLNRDPPTTGSGLHDLVHTLVATEHRAHPGDGTGHRAPWSGGDTPA